MFATKEQIRKLGRLQKRSDFLSVQAAGRKWVSKSLILQISPNEQDAHGMRAGFTVSKKISTSAVVRNRIKRRLRAAARDVLPLKGQAGMDYVLIGRTDTATRAYADITKDLAWCLRKLETAGAEGA